MLLDSSPILTARVGKLECPSPGQWSAVEWRRKLSPTVRLHICSSCSGFDKIQIVVPPIVYLLQFSFWSSFCSRDRHCTLFPDTFYSPYLEKAPSGFVECSLNFSPMWLVARGSPPPVVDLKMSKAPPEKCYLWALSWHQPSKFGLFSQSAPCCFLRRGHCC